MTFFKPLSQNMSLYLFNGGSAFLLGLLPFFIPIILWQQGFSVAQIFGAISLSSLTFVATIWVWDRLRHSWQLVPMINLALCLEIVLVISLLWLNDIWWLPVVAILFGAYNGIFNLTQRIMFLHTVNQKNFGSTYGNLQICTFVMFKISILLGAVWLDNAHWFWLIFTSLVTVIVLLVCFLKHKNHWKWPKIITMQPPISFSTVIKFRDTCRSRFIFALDGPFLFAESWCWGLTMFLVLGSSFINFGVTTVAISIPLALIFWLIKNDIDHNLSQCSFFYLGIVLLYVSSWLLRWLSPQINNFPLLLVIITLIMFFTAYFRLLFNKKFYDCAHRVGYSYLIIKSYYSQSMLAIFFAAAGLYFAYFDLTITELHHLYLIAALGSLGYLAYKQTKLVSPGT